MQNREQGKKTRVLCKENLRLKTELSNDPLHSALFENKDKIHKEQLLLADKMESLGVLINSVAHDINNPNSFINVNVAVLQKIWEDLKPLLYNKIEKNPDFKIGNIPGNKLEKSVDGLLSGIKTGSERIGKLIEILKAYMSNDLKNAKEIFDLHDVIRDVNLLLKNQTMKATNKFIMNLKDEKLLVNGVKQKIEQVIINVLQDVCQALNSREQSIRIETTADLSDRLAIVKIVYTGNEIKSEHSNNPNTTRYETAETGLNLSVSSFILEEHNGYFKFSPQKDYETTVEIILPLANDNKHE